MLLDPQIVHAWCEGVSLSQADGNRIVWWGSNNADLVRRLGLMPSGAAFLGSVVGSAAAAASSLASAGTIGAVQGGAALQGMGTGSTGALQTATDALSGAQNGIPPAITSGMGVPTLQGGQADNPFTAFDGGGPGICAERGLPNYWVNTSILNLVVRDTISSWTGLPPSVDLILLYNSGSAAKKGMFGAGWSFTYDCLLTQSSSAVTISKGSGQRETFTLPDGMANITLPVELIPPADCYHSLLYYGDYWLYITKDSHLMHRFDQVVGTEQARLTQISDYHGNTLQIVFDEHDHIGSLTDDADQPVQFTDPAGKITHLQYDKVGNLLALQEEDGQQINFAYDPCNRLVKVTDLLNHSYSVEHDPLGRISFIANARREKINFAYNQDGEIVEKQYNGATVASYEYDAAGNLAGVADTTGRTVYGYNAVRQVETVEYPDSTKILFAYDPGQVISPL